MGRVAVSLALKPLFSDCRFRSSAFCSVLVGNLNPLSAL